MPQAANAADHELCPPSGRDITPVFANSKGKRTCNRDGFRKIRNFPPLSRDILATVEERNECHIIRCGIHLHLVISRATSFEAILPIFPKTALSKREKDFLTSSKQHLNF